MMLTRLASSLTTPPITSSFVAFSLASAPSSPSIEASSSASSYFPFDLSTLSFSSPTSASSSAASPSKQTQKCGICLEDLVLPACDDDTSCSSSTLEDDSNNNNLAMKAFRCKYHSFCSGCLCSFFSLHIREGTIEDMLCPAPSCRKRQVLPGFIQRLVTSGLFDRFLTLSLNRALDSMQDIAWCPKCHAPVVGDSENQGYAHCANCTFCFCVSCNESWHPGRCGMVWVETASSQPSKSLADSDRAWMATFTKRCPKCMVHIEKNGGCNHMFCARCKTHFQWTDAPDSLYLTAQMKRDMKNMEEQRKKEEEKELRRMQREDAARAKESRLRERKSSIATGRLCPNCRKVHIKKNNLNQIVCGNCRTAFCFECGRRTNGSTKHFDGSGCKQHSPVPTAPPSSEE